MKNTETKKEFVYDSFKKSEKNTGRHERMKRDLIDNILESCVKLGFADTPITFYYPETSLTELFGCGRDEIPSAIAEFRKNEQDNFGNIEFEALHDEKRRYAVKVPAEGIEWVHANFEPSDFIKEFVKEIKKPGITLNDIADFFRRFSPTVDIKKISLDEWALSFTDENIDPYVYHIEQNEFGLEYHRFTKEAYRNLMENDNPEHK